MLIATLTFLVMKIKDLGIMCAAGTEWGNWFQLVIAAAMVVLAVFLIIEGIRTFAKQTKSKANT